MIEVLINHVDEMQNLLIIKSLEYNYYNILKLNFYSKITKKIDENNDDTGSRIIYIIHSVAR